MCNQLIKLIKLKICLVFLNQNDVVGKENYLVFLCSANIVKICHNNQHDLMISHGLP